MLTEKTDHPAVSGLPPRLRVNLRQVEVFVATARAGSTRSAAERVARSQSAASSAIAELEATLGAALFDRVRRRLVLNENGRALLPKAAALLDHAAELEHLFDGAHAAPLRVAASMTIGEVLLPDLVTRWKQSHPNSPVHIAVGNSSEVVRAVASFDVDVGFIEGPQTHPDLSVRPWLSDELVVVAAPQHPLAGLRRVSPEALRAAAWAVREHGSGTREATDRWLLEHLGSIDVSFELGSSEALKRILYSGAAVGCLSRHVVAAALAGGTLVQLRTGLAPLRRQMAIVLHKNKQLGRGAADFVTHCVASAQAATKDVPGKPAAAAPAAALNLGAGGRLATLATDPIDGCDTCGI
jgi:DNA-binding transcriptional LysR family regulator